MSPQLHRDSAPITLKRIPNAQEERDYAPRCLFNSRFLEQESCLTSWILHLRRVGRPPSHVSSPGAVCPPSSSRKSHDTIAEPDQPRTLSLMTPSYMRFVKQHDLRMCAGAGRPLCHQGGTQTNCQVYCINPNSNRDNQRVTHSNLKKFISPIEYKNT